MKASTISRDNAVIAFRNRRGETVDTSSVTATDAKKEFARVLEMVIQGGVVVITSTMRPRPSCSPSTSSMRSRTRLR
jgi:hypothetical protein